MTLSDVAIKRPIFTSMMALCLVVLGAMGLGRLGTDLFPDVTFPVVIVQAVYRGAGPAEVETQVVKPLEDAIAGINGVEKMHSWSRENAGIIAVEFKLTESLDRAVQDVRDKVAGAQSLLPREIDPPKVSRVDVGASPILVYSVSAKLPSQQLRKLLVDRVQPALQQLPGVGEVRLLGGDVREIQVDIDLDKARAVGVSPFEIAQRIGLENLSLPAGHLTLGPTELGVRTVGQFSTVGELRALPIAASSTGSQVRLDEIATVTDGLAEKRTLARLNGQESIAMEVVKQSGSNTVKVADQAKIVLARLLPELPGGVQASLLIDLSAFIRENAREVYIALLFGGAMAVLIILVFLLDLRGTFISSLALPTSVVGTFFVMYVLGYTLNQMTLLALSLAIGLLIDDAVVVREAITRRLDRGEPPAQAASNGTREVGLAVMATTFTLVAVFVPVAFMPGIVGQFFKQFGLTISAAVLISLFISFTVDPMLSARLVKQRKPGEKLARNAVARRLGAMFDAWERFYARSLRWVLAHKWTTVGLTVAVLVGSLALAKDLGTEFTSVEDRAQLMAELELPDTASLELTTRRAAEAEALLRAMPEVTDVYTVVGPAGEIHKATMRVLLTPKNRRSKGILAIKDEFRARLQGTLPATAVTITDPPMIEALGGFYPIIVRVTGPDLAQVTQHAKFVADVLKRNPGTADVKLEANRPKPELAISVDRTRAADLGLPVAQVALQLRLALQGEVAARLRQGAGQLLGDDTDIRVRVAERDRRNADRIREMDLWGPRGLRKVSDVARVGLQDGPSVIEHEDRERQIAVLSQLASGAALGDVVAALRKAVAAHQLPAGYAVRYDGQIRTLDEQNEGFSSAFMLAFVFIFMVLASQFESLKHPATIMVSLPLALIGALLGLVLTRNLISMGAMIGIILLMGLVTKNAILLVDGALQHLREGDDVDQALMKAGPRRLRPILMTSFAMAIGMLPTAIGRGGGSEFRSPMAITVIGGVITSTVLTLLVVPVVFAFVEKLRFRRARAGHIAAAARPTVHAVPGGALMPPR